MILLSFVIDLTREIGRQAGLLVCCLARCVVTRLAACPVRGLEITACCCKCEAERGGVNKGVTIAIEELAPLFKLIGRATCSTWRGEGR